MSKCIWCSAQAVWTLCVACISKQDSTGIPHIIDMVREPFDRENIEKEWLDVVGADRMGDVIDGDDIKYAYLFKGEDRIGLVQNFTVGPS